MARKRAKCGTCDDLLYFVRNSPIGQTVICTCGDTKLSESGVTGNPVALSNQDKDDLDEGVLRDDVLDMRAIFDAAPIPRRKHCFRWNNPESRWELSQVEPENRTLIAYLHEDEWVEV